MKIKVFACIIGISSVTVKDENDRRFLIFNFWFVENGFSFGSFYGIEFLGLRKVFDADNE